MSKNRGYRDLLVWHKAMDMVCDLYRITDELPKEEKFGLISQMRRSAVSVPSNIAEGCARNSLGEFGQFLGIATGSLAELDTQTELAMRLTYMKQEDYTGIKERIEEVRKMLNGLKKSLKNS